MPCTNRRSGFCPFVSRHSSSAELLQRGNGSLNDLGHDAQRVDVAFGDVFVDLAAVNEELSGIRSALSDNQTKTEEKNGAGFEQTMLALTSIKEYGETGTQTMQTGLEAMERMLSESKEEIESFKNKLTVLMVLEGGSVLGVLAMIVLFFLK